MISLAFIILFFFSVALGVACVLVTYQLINNYDSSFLKNYFYYLISFYTFAIYAIWGQIIVRTLLAQSSISSEVIERTANFLPVLGVPFLFVSWIMLINMAHSIFEIEVGRLWRYFHGLLFILILSGAWFGYNYLSEGSQFSNASLKYYAVAFVSILSLFNYLIFMILIKYFERSIQIKGQQFVSRFSWLLLLAFGIRSIATIFAFSGLWFLGIMILIYFTTNFIPLYYLRLNADEIFHLVKAEKTNEDKIDFIFKRYNISKREKEIVRHICFGKTNQQIADELFISLQTVKDHTHRIYTKIGINSRMKLVQMVNG